MFIYLIYSQSQLIVCIYCIKQSSHIFSQAYFQVYDSVVTGHMYAYMYLYKTVTSQICIAEYLVTGQIYYANISIYAPDLF